MKKKTIKKKPRTRPQRHALDELLQLRKRNEELTFIINQLEKDKHYFVSQVENYKIMHERVGRELISLQNEVAQIRQFKNSLKQWLRD